MAVYTKVSENDAAEFLRAYDLGTLTELVGIKQGVENTNYFLTTTQGRYVLTLYEKRVNEGDFPFFFGLMEHLVKKGISCPLPIKTRDGGTLGRLAGRPAVIISFLEGAPAPRITPEACAATGRALATLHLAAADFPIRRANGVALPEWERLLTSSKARADEVYPGLGALMQEELDYLRMRWPQDLPEGVIHADLFPDNVFFNGPDICGVIDFTFACNDLLAYDLALCLNAWCFERDTAFNITKARALIKGYQEVRMLTPEETKMLPLLARGAALRILSTRLYDWLNQVPDALVKPKDPLDYLTRLQFHQMVRTVSAYGLAA